MWEDGSEVSIGLPLRKLKAKDWTAEDATRSYLGGRPSYPRPGLAEDAQPRCSLCTQRMRFVAQVYAPTESLHRTLYVHACATRRCSLQSKGWAVTRHHWADGDHGERSSSSGTPPAVLSDKGGNEPKQGKKDDSKGPQGAIATVFGGVGGFDSWLDGSDDPSIDELTGMLQLAHTAPKSPSPSSSSSSSSSAMSARARASEPVHPSTTTTTVPPGWLIDVQWEPYADVHQGISNDKVRAMLESYAKEEEDSALVETLRVHMRAKGDTGDESSEAGDGDDGDDGEEDEAHVLAVARSRAAIAGAGGSDQLPKSAGSGRMGMSHDKIFRDRVARAPRQVMRYAYGGYPLWCQAPGRGAADMCRRPPVCKGCGTQSVFEMQLMPALLTFLGTDLSDARHKHRDPVEIGTAVVVPSDGGSDGKANANPSASEAAPTNVVAPTVEQIEGFFADLEQGGIDFGVAAVWSCPVSCEKGNGGLESIVVQPPSDLAW